MECHPIEIDNRPWGRYEVLLNSEYCKVKRIHVKPGGRLSYQKHSKRQELWMIVKGVAAITIEGVTKNYKEDDTVFIPKETAHRIANTTESEIVFIEIQRGTYFGEDDIVRLEDDYERL